ncbi:MAG TPA: hypothetical protein VFS00_08875, partial [Polyangiaceae bacterium]|nr:hypothetical protein [Polyangiaceae bacterium]
PRRGAQHGPHEYPTRPARAGSLARRGDEAEAPLTSVLITLVLLAVGALHLTPALGVLGAAPLARLYGEVPSDPGLLLMLRHRALLFGLLGAFCWAAVFVRPWRPPVFVAAFVSTAGFVALAAGQGDRLTPALRRVVAADVAAVVALLLAGALWWLSGGTGAP